MLGLIGKTLSHYRLLEQIGQGGMSSVFSAVDLRDERAVAVKILSPYIAHEPRFRARFEREIKLLTRLQHPNIMPILDFGEVDGLAFIVMPYLGSGTLSDRLQQGPMEPKDGARVISQLASALAAAHAAGVVHRDVKPSNVLMDPLGNALLSDFSFAHQSDASQNLTGSALIGTPAYMSPEQCRGEPIDARSDQYALAVLLYQMATGCLPFEGDTPMATAMKHVNEPLPRPRLVNPSLPEDVELVLVKALAKDPALRYGSVEELNQAFQQAVAMALDPARRTKTRDLDRTTAIYNKYQNVKPPSKRRPIERAALVAALLLLFACPASAAAMAFFYPDLLGGVAAAGQAPDVQGTVNVLLTANAPGLGTQMAPGEMETAVYVAVIQTLAATGVKVDAPGARAILLSLPGEATPTPFPLALVFPASSPTVSHVQGGGIGTSVPTATPAPTRTPSPGAQPTSGSSPTTGASPTTAASPTTGASPTMGASPTSGSTLVISLTESFPTATPPAPTATNPAAATHTPVPPTSPPADTPVPPTSPPPNTPVPPTSPPPDTPVPPTSPPPDTPAPTRTPRPSHTPKPTKTPK